MALPRPLEARIIRVFESARRSLPPVVAVSARRNRRRLASLSRRENGHVLNLAAAVVHAGEEAWEAVAPALEGDPDALRRLRRLAVPLMPAPDGSRAGAGGGRGRSRGARSGRERLPPPRCQGTPDQQAYLRELVAFVRVSAGGVIPIDLQLRISRSMTSALGRCTYVGTSRRVTIAERLFRPGLEDILWETVKHELAHVADQVTRSSGRSDHGPRWKEWARRLGARPERLCSPAELRTIDRILAKAPPGPLELPSEVRRRLDAHGPRAGTHPRSPDGRTGTPGPHTRNPHPETIRDAG